MAYLIPAHFTLAATAAGAPALEEKLDTLAAFVAEVLALHVAAYGIAGRVATHYEEAVTNAKDRADRLGIMGDPARYAEIGWEGSGNVYEETSDGAAIQVEHRVRVFVYYGLGLTGQTRQQAAEAFRALLESRSPTVPGLLHALRVQHYAHVGGTVAGDEVVFGLPQDAATSFVSMGQGEFRFEATFTVTLL